MGNGDRLPAKLRRIALEQLSRERLAGLTDGFQLEVADRRVVDDHINALVRSRKVEFGAILRQLSRAELQQICDALDIDRSGREKDMIVSRILAHGEGIHAPEEVPTAPRPAPVRMAPARGAAPPPSWGIATPVAGDSGAPEPLRLRTDGACVTETLAQLEHGFAGEPIARPVLERIKRQAEDVISDILKVYAQDVAAGEVGANGTATASAAPPIAGNCPTALLYGRIQSGKTNAMIVTTALALDNGFRTVVVFTSNFVKLVEQTLDRFRALDGPLVYSSTEAGGGTYQWEQDIGNIRRNIADKGLVLICAKDATHQRALLDLLRKVGATDYPALIFDDEADQATPDTTNAARSQQRAGAPAQGSVTYRLTVENDAASELGESTREILQHNVFVQVTATPYALLLQNSDSPLRPKFTRLLEPGDGYTGGEHFFSNDMVREQLPPIVFVEETESAALQTEVRTIPDGLSKAIAFFLVSATAYQVVSRARPPEGYKLLCHTSPRTVEHEQVGHFIRQFVDELSEQMRAELRPEMKGLFSWAHGELLRSFPHAPSLDALTAAIQNKLHLRRVLIINSTSAQADFGSSYNFMVGGNILGRGLTIKHLLATYYLRNAQTTQMDTMLQHARMYGYRRSLMPFTRVFLPPSLAVRFNRIHEAESALRELLKDPKLARIPVRVAGDLRPTRRSVLDTGSIGAYRPGQQVYPIEPEYRSEQLGRSVERIEELLRDCAGEPIPQHEFLHIDIERVIEFIEAIRLVDEERGSWDRKALATVLRAIAPEYGGTAHLFIREFTTQRGPEIDGAISGPEHDAARATGKPVLFLFREQGKKPPWDGASFWYPTIVFPTNMPTQVFNTSP